MTTFGLKKIKGDVYTATLTEKKGIDVNEDEVLAPYKDRALAFSESLPPYISVELKISKTGISDVTKDNDVLPAGITRTKSDVLTIR